MLGPTVSELKTIKGAMNISGIAIGHAHDAAMATGVSVVIADPPAVCAVDVRGGAPGTRETDAISGRGLIEAVHAVVLSGGSAFGLSAASGVQAMLAAAGRGFPVANVRVPIVPQAILFDLMVGERALVTDPMRYEKLGREAVRCAQAAPPAMGSVGAGFGATTANLRGGLGWACQSIEGFKIAAMVAVNAVGQVTVGDTAHFHAAMFERDGECGALGPAPMSAAPSVSNAQIKGAARQTGSSAFENTTIGVVMTTATLDQRGCQRLAAMAHTGLARAIYPVHTPLDGDTIFALATAADEPPVDATALTKLGSAGADCMARAVSLAIYHADPAPLGWSGPPAYCERFAKS